MYGDLVLRTEFMQVNNVWAVGNTEDMEPGKEEVVQRELYYPAGSVWGEGDPKRTRSVNRNWWQNAPAAVSVTDQDYQYNGCIPKYRNFSYYLCAGSVIKPITRIL